MPKPHRESWKQIRQQFHTLKMIRELYTEQPEREGLHSHTKILDPTHTKILDPTHTPTEGL